MDGGFSLVGVCGVYLSCGVPCNDVEWMGGVLNGYPRLILLFPNILVEVKTKEDHERMVKHNLWSIIAAIPLSLLLVGFIIWVSP